MKKKKSALALGLLLGAAAVFGGDKTNQYDYAYGPNDILESVAGFTIARTIDGVAFPTVMEGVDAISIGNGRIYLADSTSSAVHILDAQTYEYVTTMKVVLDAEGETAFAPGTATPLTLKNPEGVYINEGLGELYIADTGAERIIVVDPDTLALKRVITRPDDMPGVTNFKPSKIAVDTAGRIYFVVSGSYEGIVELNPDGAFSRYYGVNKPQVNLLDYFWKSLASQTQKQKMAKTFAPSFSNLDIDDEGFVYAVTYDTASERMIFRFNAKGENVIRDEGYIKLRGDLTRMFINRNVSSAFTDISSTGFGVYAVVDRSYGRVFVYDFDGYMITVFSKLGDMKGDLKQPSSIAWNGYDIIVGDKSLGRLYVYTPTNFGRAALNATEYYNKGDWATATAYFEDAVSYNANYYAGYAGIGRNYLMQRDYERAMYYFKLASDTEMYSEAFNGYRGLWIQKYFVWFIIAAVLLTGAVIYSEIRYARKNAA